MNRSIIDNEFCLPQRQAQGRKISIGTLAMLERLGNPLVGTIMGLGDAKFTDSVEHLLQVLWLHSVDEQEFRNILREIDNVSECRMRAIVWGQDMAVNELADRLNTLLSESDMIASSMVTMSGKQQSSEGKG